MTSEMSFDNLLAKSKMAGVSSLPGKDQLDSNDELNKESVLAKEERMAQIRKLVKDSSLKEAQDRASQLVLQYPIEAKIHSDLGGIMYEMGDYESAEPARRINARHELDSFKQVWCELKGRDCNKEECPPWDDDPLLQSDQPAESEHIESFLQ